MKLSVLQQLALSRPYDIARAEKDANVGPGPEHISTQWIGTDVNIKKVFTVSIPAEGKPFWHVSMSVTIRDVGTILMSETERVVRRRLRAIGEEMLRGVGEPADADEWDIGDKALHLYRPLTDEEIAWMGRHRVV